MATQLVIDILKADRLFDNLPEGELRGLATSGRQRGYPARSSIFGKGDPGTALYLILSGTVQISTTSYDGRRITLNLLEAGRLFGEIAVLDGGPRTADATAWTEARLFVIDRAAVMTLLRRQPDFAQKIIDLLCLRLRWTSEAVEDSAFMQLPQRLAKRLLLLSERFGQTGRRGTLIALDISQEDLGTFAGVSRESVNKQLHRWRDSGVIGIEDGQILLRRSEILESLALGE